MAVKSLVTCYVKHAVKQNAQLCCHLNSFLKIITVLYFFW